MKNFVKHLWALLFLAIMFFQITGATLHFYDQSSCNGSTAHHEDSSVSPNDHCKICDNLSLLHTSYEFTPAYTFTAPFLAPAETYITKTSAATTSATGNFGQRGPPAFGSGFTA
ncbi:MAG: hypothetical protein V4616_09670 [Bacteroidota bacterium]